MSECWFEQSSGPRCVNDYTGHKCPQTKVNDPVIEYRGKTVIVDRALLEAVMDYARTEANQRLGSGLYNEPDAEREYVQLIRDTALKIANLVEF